MISLLITDVQCKKPKKAKKRKLDAHLYINE